MVRPASPVRLARYGFGDAAKAAAALATLGLWDDAAQRPRDAHAEKVLAELGGSADPDLAVYQLSRLAEAASRAAVDGPDLSDESTVARLSAVLGASTALGDHLAATPGEWSHLDDPVLRVGPDATVPALKLAYRRALLAIAADDLTGRRDIEDVMALLSCLADDTLRAALAITARELTADPAGLAVVAMGKCGGGELNYVSDVDVIFVARDDADLARAAALASRMMAICGQVAWPVDAALRPEGKHGPLVRTLGSHAAYYRKWARTWEFQALLKARPVAGELDLGREWLDTVSPLVWRAAERPEAVEDVRAMRRRIEDSIPPAELAREIKRGPGGLRDIEFAVQLLQLVHGRADESLRSPSTLAALRALTAGGYVGRKDGEALTRSYRFLRAVEHRLQLQRLRRTHTVPADPAGLRWLAAALGYRPNPRRDAVEAFRADWVGHATEVRRLHAKLLYRPLLEAVARVPAEGLRLTTAAARDRLEVLGFADPAGALRHIQALTGGVSRTAAIQHTLLPALLSEFADAPEPDRGLLAYRQVSENLGATPWYLRLLRDEGAVSTRLARLLGLSRYVADLLVRDPEALRLLAADAELAPRDAAALHAGFTAAARRHTDPVAAVSAVRALRRRELFRIACADLLGMIDTDQVGRALAGITDATLAAALSAAGGDGQPFAIIGMGRLGGGELSYPSDADVLFVFDDDLGEQRAHDIAEELRRLLSAPAPDPPLGVDAGLRPEGRQGPLVRSLAAYAQYYARWSKVWEAQALLRARHVAGDPDLGARFLDLVEPVRYPAGGLTPAQVTEIRRIKARVDGERLPRGADPATHTKLGRGGLADVEWTVQLLQLRHADQVPDLRTPRTLDALDAACAAGLIGIDDAAALREAWLLATRVRNAITLIRGRPSDQLPRWGVELTGVARVLGRRDVDPGELLDTYLRTARHARQVVERIF